MMREAIIPGISKTVTTMMITLMIKVAQVAQVEMNGGDGNDSMDDNSQNPASGDARRIYGNPQVAYSLAGAAQL